MMPKPVVLLPTIIPNAFYHIILLVASTHTICCYGQRIQWRAQIQQGITKGFNNASAPKDPIQSSYSLKYVTKKLPHNTSLALPDVHSFSLHLRLNVPHETPDVTRRPMMRLAGRPRQRTDTLTPYQLISRCMMPSWAHPLTLTDRTPLCSPVRPVRGWMDSVSQWCVGGCTMSSDSLHGSCVWYGVV